MAGTYEPIATVTLSGGYTVTFSSIPQTYTDLVLVASTQGGGADNGWVYLNGDTNSRYSYLSMQSSGGGIGSGGSGNWNSMLYSIIGAQYGNPLVFNIMNYSSAVGYKTILAKVSSTYGIQATSFQYRDTAAITSLTMATQSYASLGSGTITLYGIKAA